MPNALMAQHLVVWLAVCAGVVTTAVACDNTKYSVDDLLKMPEAALRYPGALYQPDQPIRQPSNPFNHSSGLSGNFGSNDPPVVVGAWFGQYLGPNGWVQTAHEDPVYSWRKQELSYRVECNSDHISPTIIPRTDPLSKYRTVCKFDFYSGPAITPTP
jgi:hypothetical protein